MSAMILGRRTSTFAHTTQVPRTLPQYVSSPPSSSDKAHRHAGRKTHSVKSVVIDGRAPRGVLRAMYSPMRIHCALRAASSIATAMHIGRPTSASAQASGVPSSTTNTSACSPATRCQHASESVRNHQAMCARNVGGSLTRYPLMSAYSGTNAGRMPPTRASKNDSIVVRGWVKQRRFSGHKVSFGIRPCLFYIKACYGCLASAALDGVCCRVGRGRRGVSPHLHRDGVLEAGRRAARYVGTPCHAR